MKCSEKMTEMGSSKTPFAAQTLGTLCILSILTITRNL